MAAFDGAGEKNCLLIVCNWVEAQTEQMNLVLHSWQWFLDMSIIVTKMENKGWLSSNLVGNYARMILGTVRCKQAKSNVMSERPLSKPKMPTMPAAFHL